MLLNAALAAFDLHERADRRFVDRNRDVFVGELLAVLLVPEPHAEAQLFQDVEQQQAIADDRLHFFAELHRRALHRPFEGQQRLAALHPHAQHAAAEAQLIVVRIEEAVFLQTPTAQRCGARGENRLPRFLRIAKTQFDLAL